MKHFILTAALLLFCHCFAFAQQDTTIYLDNGDTITIIDSLVIPFDEKMDLIFQHLDMTDVTILPLGCLSF
jgi:hypothetical protein